jgi:hypothetical protein
MLDFDGDGRADIIWRKATGEIAVWIMNGLTLQSAAYVYANPTTFAVVPKP